MPTWMPLLRTWLKLSARNRLAAGMLAGVVVMCVAISISRSGGSRTPLFATPLHSEQLDEVEQRLAEWSVSYTPLADNVVVDGKHRSDLLLRLSLAGVPHAHVESSSEMLAKIGALTPQSIIDEQKRAGLAADLQLALRGIEGVQDASLIIAPDKPALYADEESREATASVRLRLRPGMHLSANAIAGIRAFVAAGVPGLVAKHVTIVDDRGVALDDRAGGTDPQELQVSLQSALDSTFGSGASIVRVSPLAASASRLSIAVAVDERYARELYQIRALASAAAGLDPRRHDTLEVQAVHFGTGVPQRRTLWLGVFGAALSAAPTLIVCIAVLVGLRIGIKPTAMLLKTIVRGASVARTQRAVTGFAPAQVRGVLRDEPPHTAAAIISALPTATAAAVLDLYPAQERAAIIRRMSRAQSPLVPDVETVIANA